MVGPEDVIVEPVDGGAGKFVVVAFFELGVDGGDLLGGGRYEESAGGAGSEQTRGEVEIVFGDDEVAGAYEETVV